MNRSLRYALADGFSRPSLPSGVHAAAVPRIRRAVWFAGGGRSRGQSASFLSPQSQSQTLTLPLRPFIDPPPGVCTVRQRFARRVVSHSHCRIDAILYWKCNPAGTRGIIDHHVHPFAIQMQREQFDSQTTASVHASQLSTRMRRYRHLRWPPHVNLLNQRRDCAPNPPWPRHSSSLPSLLPIRLCPHQRCFDGAGSSCWRRSASCSAAGEAQVLSLMSLRS